MTAARIILSGCTLSCSGADPTEVTDAAQAACPAAPTVSLCDALMAIWIVGADDEIAAADEPQLVSPAILTAGAGLHQHDSIRHAHVTQSGKMLSLYQITMQGN